MNKKTIIIGSVIATILMLITPCISAVNVQTTKQVIKEKVQERIETLSEKTNNKLMDALEDIFLGIGYILAAIIFFLSFFFLGGFFWIPAYGFVCGLFDEDSTPFEGMIEEVIDYFEFIRDLFYLGLHMIKEGIGKLLPSM